MLNSEFIVAVQNIRSMRVNFDSFLSHLDSLPSTPHFLFLTETWIHECERGNYQLPDYTLHTSCNENYRSGGVAAFVRRNIDIDIIESVNPKIHSFDCILLKCKIDQIIFSFVCIYRLHSAPITTFCSDLEGLLITLNDLDNVYFLGDFNIDLLKVNQHRDDFLFLFSSFGFEALVNSPTRVCNNSSSCIDNIFVRCNHRILRNHCDVYELNITDHSLLYLSVGGLKLSKVSPVTTTLSLISYAALNDLLLRENWEHVLSMDDASASFSLFIQKLQDMILTCSFVPTPGNFHRKLKPWISNSLLRDISVKNKLYKRLKKHPNDTKLKNQYKIACKLIRSRVAAEKMAYYNERFKMAKGDGRAQWRLINELTGRGVSTSTSIDKISYNNNVYTSSIDIANCLNNFFISTPGILVDKLNIPVNSTSNTTSSNHYSHGFFIFPATGSEVLRTIQNLQNNKSKSYDSITTDCVKKIAFNLVDILTILINRCFETGTFPDCLKIAVIVPIHKKGSRSDPNNYRPISLLSIFSKIIEKLLKSRLESFLNRENILSTDQYGFIRGRCTEDAITTLVDEISLGANKGECVGAIFLDLTKAFDTVSHSKLLEILSCVGINGIGYEIFESYLTNRRQSVRLNGGLSDFGVLEYGVPQGTVLGPILFLIYLNNLLKLNLTCRILAYADDLVLVFRGETWSEVSAKMDVDLRSVRLWLDEHSLLISSKSRVVRFFLPSNGHDTLPCHSSLCTGICGEACINIPLVDEVTYLGVTIDSRLTWKPHICRVKDSLAPIIANAFQIGKFCPRDVARSFYFACVQSRLQYGLTTWGNALPTSFKSIEMVQRTAIRALFRKRKYDSLWQTFVDLHILPIAYFFKYKTLRTFYNRGGFLNSRRIRAMRMGLTVPVPFPRKEWFKHSFAFVGPSLYNSLPEHLRVRDVTYVSFCNKVNSLIWREFRAERV